MKLEDSVGESLSSLRETKSRFENPVILWSTGKDSTLTLSLCRDAFFGEVPFPVLHIDAGQEFSGMHKFRDLLAKEWNLDLIIENSDKHSLIMPEKTGACQESCQFMNTDVLRKIIEKHNFDAVIVSVYSESPLRTPDSRVESLQTVEFWDTLQKKFGKDFPPTNIYPILHWNEIDVWRYTSERNLPVNPLYFAKDGKRYRSLASYLCKAPIKSEATTIEEIINELQPTKKESSSSVQDEESQEIMKRLKELGYI
jgi:sulfate adenylyltransferase subunit 2